MNKLYRDTVTLYHADAAAQTVVHTVLRGVCWQQGRRELPDAGGTRRGAALLVVMAALGAAFVLWTVSPPALPIFTDPVDGTRGVTI